MSHLDYYRYQVTARRVSGIEDVKLISREKSYVYDRIVLPWIPADRSAAIGELACGHGSFLNWLKERQFERVAGCDSSPEQIAFAKMVTANVELADVNGWLGKRAGADFGALVGIDLVEHISKDEFMTLLARAHSALRSGGRLILRLPNGDSPLVGMNLFNDITHVWTYTPNCLNTLAMMHGFSRTFFEDESCNAIRDHRWIKVPIASACQAILRILFRAASKENVTFWSPPSLGLPREVNAYLVLRTFAKVSS